MLLSMQGNMSALTCEMLKEAREYAKDKFGIPDIIRVNIRQYHDLLEYEKHMKWLKSLSPRKRKQVILKDKIRRRIGRYKKRNLP